MIIRTLAVGPLDVNCYILGCESTHEAAVIDPGGGAESIIASLAADGLKLTHILLTHGHWDHVGAVAELKKRFDPRICLHKADEEIYCDAPEHAAMFGFQAAHPPPVDHFLDNGGSLHVGDLEITVFHTPGHTPGSVCFLTRGKVFSGDLLFKCSIGRTDLPGGDLDTLLKSIREVVFALPDDTPVLPGHGPGTTVSDEKTLNPFLVE